VVSASDSQGVTIHDPTQAWTGLTLISHACRGRELGKTQWSRPRLVDMSGQVVHAWQLGVALQLTKLQADGTLLCMTYDRSEIFEAGLYRLAPDSTVLWRYHCRIDHDFFPLDNGNILIHTIADRMCPVLGNELRRHPYLLEVTPEKELVWEWKGEEHLQELIDLGVLALPIDWDARGRLEVQQRAVWDPSLRDLSPAKRRKAEQYYASYLCWDWAHNNTCQVIAENDVAAKDPRFRPGNIIFSYRTLDIIGVIDRATGEIVWAWGPGVLDGQHKPHMLPDGHILIYDNGTLRNYSRVIEMDPISGEVVWEYASDPKESFFSPSISGAQRLPNGNTLICEGESGRVFEVTRQGEMVWEFRSPFRGVLSGREVRHVYRSLRYAHEYCRPLFG